MKIYSKVLIPVVFIVVAIFAYQKLKPTSGEEGGIKKLQGFDGKVHYRFKALPDGVIGQVGEHQVVAEEVERTAPMRSFRNRKRDLLFAIIYKQFVTNNETPVEKIEFSFKKVSLSPSAILNQFGIQEKYSTQIQFQTFDPSQGLAKVDGQVITKKDIDFNNFIWAAYETEVYRYKLSAIDKLLKQKTITSESKKLKLRTQDYQEKYIDSQLPTEISDNDIDDYLKKYSIEDTARNRQSARNTLLRQRKERGLDYILERYVMDLPISIALKGPDYKLDTKDEWTASLGEPGDLRVTLFSGTRNAKTVEMLKKLIPLIQSYGGIHFFYRPFFPPSDRMQDLTAQMQFCVLTHHEQEFWDYFLNTLGDFREQTEKVLYEKSEALGLDTSKLKQCLIAQKYKEVVDYHIQYGQFLGITTGPVLYIGGEVLHGAIRMQDVESILQRKLNIPAAGVW